MHTDSDKKLHKGGSGMFGKRKAYKVEEGIVKIQFTSGEGWITPLTEEIVNVFSPMETLEHRSKAVEGKKA